MFTCSDELSTSAVAVPQQNQILCVHFWVSSSFGKIVSCKQCFLPPPVDVAAVVDDD